MARVNLQLRAWKSREWQRMLKRPDTRIIQRGIRRLARKRRKMGEPPPTTVP